MRWSLGVVNIARVDAVCFDGELGAVSEVTSQALLHLGCAVPLGRVGARREQRVKGFNAQSTVGMDVTIGRPSAANEQEFERFTISSEVDERTLREIYFPPFLAAVRDAHVWALMASYNLVNGVAAAISCNRSSITSARRLLCA